MFLNIKFQRLCKSHHLQRITSSKDSEKLEKSLCVRESRRPLIECPWSSGPQMTLHHSSTWFCHWHYYMGPGILPETTVGKHNPPCHLQMPTKALSCKKEAICEHGPEVLSCAVGQGSFKMKLFQSGKVFYSQTSPNLTFLLEITDTMSFGLKRRETFQLVISVQFKSQHLWWYGGA